MSPKIVKQEDGPSVSDLDSSDQDLEYRSKNWTNSPGARRRDKMRDSLDRIHLSKDQSKLSQQDRAYSDDQRNLHRSDPYNERLVKHLFKVIRKLSKRDDNRYSPDRDSPYRDNLDRLQSLRQHSKQNQGAYRRRYDQCSPDRDDLDRIQSSRQHNK